MSTIISHVDPPTTEFVAKFRGDGVRVRTMSCSEWVRVFGVFYVWNFYSHLMGLLKTSRKDRFDLKDMNPPALEDVLLREWILEQEIQCRQRVGS